MKKQVLFSITTALLVASMPVVLIAVLAGPLSVINIALSITIPAAGLGFWEEYNKKQLVRQLVAVFLSAAVLCGLLLYFKV